MYKYRTTFTDENHIRHDVKANTKKELAEKINRIKNGTQKKITKITLKEWSDICFDKYKSNLKPNTFYIQKNCFENHVNRYIGKERIDLIKPIDCQNVINYSKGFANYTTRRISQLMKFVFERAVENDIINKNPAAHIRPPHGAKLSRRALSKEEVEVFVNVAKKTPNYAFFMVMLYAGLRNSEVANLKGKDIISIQGKRFIHVNGTKSQNAKRDVPCVEKLYNCLPIVAPDEYLFKNQAGGKMTKPNYERLWKHLKKDMNIYMGCKTYRGHLVPPYPIAEDLVSYDLRHTFCTNLMKAGVDVRVAQKLMGHADIRLTANIYSHTDREEMLNAAELMESVENNVEI